MFYEISGYISNKYYDELVLLSPAIRHATLFKHTVEDMPLEIRDGDLFAGWYGFENDDLKPAEVKAYPPVECFTPHEAKIRDHLRDDLKMHIAFTSAHTCIDYGKIVEKIVRSTLLYVEYSEISI